MWFVLPQLRGLGHSAMARFSILAQALPFVDSLGKQPMTSIRQSKKVALTRVLFVSQRRAESMQGRPTAAIISITDPGQVRAELKSGWGATLRVAFHDSDPITFPFANQDLTPMKEVQGLQIAQFIEAIPQTVRSLVVHCRSGISRSAAIAKAIAEAHGLAFDPSYFEFNRHVYAITKAHLRPVA